MNLVLGDAEEFRKLPPKKGKSDTEVRKRAAAQDAARALCAQQRCCSQREERRVLGLLLLRGNEIISITIEGPPPADVAKAAKAGAAAAVSSLLTLQLALCTSLSADALCVVSGRTWARASSRARPAGGSARAAANRAGRASSRCRRPPAWHDAAQAAGTSSPAG